MSDPEIYINEKKINSTSVPYVIAEIGSNFDQSYNTAIDLIDMATDCGADAVKFQMFKAENLMDVNDPNFPVFKKAELDRSWIKNLSDYSRIKKIDFLCSPFDKEAVDILEDNNICAYKIASSEVTNFSLLSYIAKTNKPILLSTGMSDLVDIYDAIQCFLRENNNSFAIMQCTSNYPTEISDVNLNNLILFKNTFNCLLGLSDHSISNIPALVSLGLGCKIFEKHITYNKNSNGPDHFYSYDKHEFHNYISEIHKGYLSLGSNHKNLQANEKLYGRRDGLYAIMDLQIGDVISSNSIISKRPALGVRGRYLSSLVGLKVNKMIKMGEPIFWDDIDYESS